MVAHMVRAHRLDSRRVFVTGLSAGGAMASVMLATYPDVFAGGAIVAGLPYGVAGNLPEALGAMYADTDRDAGDLATLVRQAAPRSSPPPRVAIWHGGADATVRPHNAVEIARQWAAVHGLDLEPDETQHLSGRTRLLWRSPVSGEVVIESNLVQGLGHGTPLSTTGPDGVGSAAPYMLEAGVSSSLEIARFWGLTGVGAGAEALEGTVEPPLAARERAKPETAPRPASLGEQIVASVGGHVPPDVEKVIAKAMRTAGLMK
jgi:poly(3-hydroxybutyrate) depolymerase